MRKKVCDEAMINRVREDIENSPKREPRKRGQALRICYRTLCGVVKEDLGKFPYHIQTNNMLTIRGAGRPWHGYS